MYRSATGNEVGLIPKQPLFIGVASPVGGAHQSQLGGALAPTLLVLVEPFAASLFGKVPTIAVITGGSLGLVGLSVALG
ncbi:MAG: hypothetical protein P3X23_009125 [Thermosynechococcus sp. Uc]|uniref:hypothetical protein n=1 Tax=Thermosynechococcus sp. Uc TaxID=3034853 RepID=UPI00259EF889|nr:hypothetical protein [Thermosynechococcus sp. Uc]MDM7327259.1 hypothetical protein [Thermosynechococcus sp. Uc]